MKVALISYEYPPDTAYGGIATYVDQAVRMLRDHGHYVEVFAGTERATRSAEENGVLTHRIREGDPVRFAEPAGAAFAERHRAVGFDVVEGPEYLADARIAVERVPDIPLVVKLHTPSRLLLRLNYYQRSFARRVWLYGWGLRHGHASTWGYAPEIEGHRANVDRLDVLERGHAHAADEIATPSQSLGDLLRAEWGLDASLLARVPYPYSPAQELLAIPVATDTRTVTFVGRLEQRKGVLDLATAIPHVLRRHPNTSFRFVGASDDSPERGLDMRDYLKRRLAAHRASVEFTGPVAPTSIPQVLETTDICVFPSVWENFPCVCLEAMAAGRAIVASSAGGMHEMLAAGQAGLVVPPNDPGRLAAAIADMLANPDRRRKLAQAARDRLLSEYSPRRIVDLQTASYARAIARRRELGPRAAVPTAV